MLRESPKVREQNLDHRINASLTSQRRTLKGVTGSQLPNIFSFPLCECSFFQGLMFSAPLPFSARFAFFGRQGRLPPYMVKQTMENVCGAISGRLWLLSVSHTHAQCKCNRTASSYPVIKLV